MVRPSSNNLQAHLNWALTSGAFKPPSSFVDSPHFQRLPKPPNIRETPSNQRAIKLSIGNEKPSHPIPLLAVSERTLSPSGSTDQERSLPTPPPNGAEYPPIELSSDLDSDLEYLASLSKAQTTHSLRSRHEDAHNPHGKKDHIIAISSSSEHEIEEDDELPSPGPATSVYRFTQALQSADSDLPRQELGSVLSEKIALLEQKIRQISVLLENNGIQCDTSVIDEKVREVDRRIEQFPGDDDFQVDLDLTSSPQAIYNSLRLPLEINNDQFDSDFLSEPQQSPIKPSATGAYGLQRRTEINSYDDDVEIADINSAIQTSNNDDVKSQARSQMHMQNSLADEQSIYNNLLDEEGIIATQSIPQRAFLTTQVASQPPSVSDVFATRTGQPWHKEMMQILRTRFGLHGFRPNQAEAVNETLSGNDVVVLMPTGGGKSLCYQLPALVTTGSTHGTTIVVSPLISLMQDQVYHLKNRNIPAEMLNSKLTAAERSAVFARLSNNDLQLLYISPEMLSISTAVRSVLHKLYLANSLARIVIDEAHCVSAWGHDFRPEYMELTKVKTEFPATPIMALTATANERVLLDIVGCLRSNPIVLKQSFNRKNLYYEVRPKTAKVIQEIASVCGTYHGKSGIIYCNSKKNCEDTAQNLRKMGVRAEFYHAGMAQKDRSDVQQLWQTGKCTVVCATIAFGMGIDKPDVRFVMHMTLPRNIEGYYQETGRAGRDGNFSQCILFYTYKDVQVLQKMIQQDTQLSYQVREHQKALLIRVMQYCENQTDCRRQQVLQYFNEDFDPRLCHQQCDNCRNMKNQGVVKKNMSAEAKAVVAIVADIAAQHVTTQQITDVLLGKKTQKCRSCGFDKMPWFGMLQSLGPLLVERLVHSLISERVLEEYSQYNHSRFPQSYIKQGPNSSAVQMGKLPILLSMARDSEKSVSSSASKKSHALGPRKKRDPNKASGFRSSKRPRR